RRLRAAVRVRPAGATCRHPRLPRLVAPRPYPAEGLVQGGPQHPPLALRSRRDVRGAREHASPRSPALFGEAATVRAVPSPRALSVRPRAAFGEVSAAEVARLRVR